jgi:hypothetical protein
MRKRKINIEFGRYKQADLAMKAKHIITCLKDNPHFPPPVLCLDEVIEASNEYSVAACYTRDGKLRTQVKKAAREKLINALRRLGVYITVECRSNVEKMFSSGFDVSKIPEPIGETPKPSNFKVIHRGKGMIRLKCNRIKYSKGYSWEWRKIDEERWNLNTTTAASILLEHLQSGKEYIFRVRVTRTSGNSPYSDEITAIVV